MQLGRELAEVLGRARTPDGRFGQCKYTGAAENRACVECISIQPGQKPLVSVGRRRGVERDVDALLQYLLEMVVLKGSDAVVSVCSIPDWLRIK